MSNFRQGWSRKKKIIFPIKQSLHTFTVNFNIGHCLGCLYRLLRQWGRKGSRDFPPEFNMCDRVSIVYVSKCRGSDKPLFLFIYPPKSSKTPLHKSIRSTSSSSFKNGLQTWAVCESSWWKTFTVQYGEQGPYMLDKSPQESLYSLYCSFFLAMECSKTLKAA